MIYSDLHLDKRHDVTQIFASCTNLHTWALSCSLWNPWSSWWRSVGWQHELCTGKLRLAWSEHHPCSSTETMGSTIHFQILANLTAKITEIKTRGQGALTVTLSIRNSILTCQKGSHLFINRTIVKLRKINNGRGRLHYNLNTITIDVLYIYSCH